MLDDRTLLDHRRMLDDPIRVGAFARALGESCSGRVVAEIGVGLGPLSLLALQSGARRVYGIEVDPRTLALATELMRQNGFGPDRFVPLLGRSDEIALPEPVDVLVGELIDSIGVGENGAWFLGDARSRWLRPGGHVIPGKIHIEVALASSAVFGDERRLFADTLRIRHGLDYRPVLGHLASPRRTLTVEPDELLTALAPWQTVDFDAGASVPLESTLQLEAHRDGAADGLVFGFVLELIEGVTIDTRPGTPWTCWEQGFLPLPSALGVRAGDRFDLALSCPTTVEPWAPVRVTLDRATHQQVENGLGTTPTPCE